MEDQDKNNPGLLKAEHLGFRVGGPGLPLSHLTLRHERCHCTIALTTLPGLKS